MNEFRLVLCSNRVVWVVVMDFKSRGGIEVCKVPGISQHEVFQDLKSPASDESVVLLLSARSLKRKQECPRASSWSREFVD